MRSGCRDEGLASEIGENISEFFLNGLALSKKNSNTTYELIQLFLLAVQNFNRRIADLSDSVILIQSIIPSMPESSLQFSFIA